MYGPQAKTRSTSAASTGSFKSSCRRPESSPSSSISPSTAMRRLKRWRGTVAMAASAAALGGRNAGERRDGGLNVGTERVESGDDGERVLHDMRTGRREAIGD